MEMMRLSPNAAYKAGSVEIWDTENGHSIYETPDGREESGGIRLFGLEFSPSGVHVATCAVEYRVHSHRAGWRLLRRIGWRIVPSYLLVKLGHPSLPVKSTSRQPVITRQRPMPLPTTFLTPDVPAITGDSPPPDPYKTL
jgi:hypothetical protein